MDNTCKNCKWWTKDKDNKEEVMSGQCHGFGPINYVDKHYFPPTLEDDFCPKFEEKAQEKSNGHIIR